jgi:HEAT repeat protein
MSRTESTRATSAEQASVATAISAVDHGTAADALARVINSGDSANLRRIAQTAADGLVRAQAIRALAEIDPETFPDLSDLLYSAFRNDDSPDVSMAAVDALATFDPPRAIGPLTELHQNNNGSLRPWAAHRLQQMALEKIPLTDADIDGLYTGLLWDRNYFATYPLAQALIPVASTSRKLEALLRAIRSSSWLVLAEMDLEAVRTSLRDAKDEELTACGLLIFA